jgi:hypothetical protein
MENNFRFAILDGACLYARLEKALAIEPKNLSLYRGSSQESLNTVAPYIFPCPLFSELDKWIVEQGWGLSWGIIVETIADFETAWKHFRKFLMVKTEEGKDLYFRFYDPRVLKMFLPTCDKDQIIDFFGPMEKFITEGDTKETAFVFSHKDGVIKQELVSVASVYGKPPGESMVESEVIRVKKRRKIIDDDF